MVGRRSKKVLQAAPSKLDKYYFDHEAADWAEQFFRNCLFFRKQKGKKPFDLLEWSIKLIRDFFGWRNKEDGTRRFKTIWLEMPKKNSKSTVAAALMLCLIFIGGLDGEDVYSLATTREQGNIVLQEAKKFIANMPAAMKRNVDVHKDVILFKDFQVRWGLLSSDVDGNDGKPCAAVTVDEVHRHPNGELIRVMKGNTAAAYDPCVIYTTTAGDKDNDYAYGLHEYAMQIRDNAEIDPTWLVLIAGATEDDVRGDGWRSVALWQRVNPNWGVTIFADEMARSFAENSRTPAGQVWFKRYRLNMWLRDEKRWMNMAAWDALPNRYTEADLIGQPCFAGLDLGTTNDMAALILPFWMPDGTVALLRRFYMPLNTVMDRQDQHGFAYQHYIDMGLIVPTPGDVIDYAYIERDIALLHGRYDIRKFGADKHQLSHIGQNLQQAGMDMVAIPQGFVGMTEPLQTLWQYVMQGQLQHGNDPVLNWMAGNMEVKTDDAGSKMCPFKRNAKCKNDGMVALAMGLWLLEQARKAGELDGRRLMI